MSGFWQMVQNRSPDLLERLLEHLKLAGIATLIAIAVGVPMGVLALRSKPARSALLGLTSVLQTVPSLALLTFLLPFFGIGATPAIIALVLYALLPIVRNTYTGLTGTPPAMLEMADALGLTRFQRLLMIESRFAAPMIMAGVRTAATVSIGIATLSAFVGAGGLGAFINRGLSLNNMDLVLLGAVPAGLLALYADWVLGVLENGLKPGHKNGPLMAQGFGAVVVGVFAFGWLYINAKSYSPQIVEKKGGRIVVGSKNFTEQFILAEIIAQALEAKTDLNVVRKLNLAGTAVCHQALLSGDIDLYPEYTGTALLSVLKVPAPPNGEDAWDEAKKGYQEQYNLDWITPFGFANTYALAVRSQDAERHGWKSITDLQPDAAHLKAGFTAEFRERDDGYPGLAKKYGFKFGKAVDMEPSLMYQAIKESQVDVISAFSTDGRIAAYDLALLEDNDHFFPPYDAGIVIRQQTLTAHPEVAEVLADLSGKLDEAKMQQLNLAVDRDKRRPKDVAKAFLEEIGLR
ncbi:MAG: hypothetical protein BGO01_01585 [Armatimonadetes bacterium 55-13]|nr:ABC transporter permease subunit [Armatimonadota bacterium]OJU65637.1 MAG: hypothetical protein BGO01_01585 [Armatimonadetes bacterium 55-13]